MLSFGIALSFGLWVRNWGRATATDSFVDRKSNSANKLTRLALKGMSLTRLLVLAAVLSCAKAAFSQQPARASSVQFAYIRPTYELREQQDRTIRPSNERTSAVAAKRKSGNISPLTRELPPAVAQPPKTRRRQILW